MLFALVLGRITLRRNTDVGGRGLRSIGRRWVETRLQSLWGSLCQLRARMRIDAERIGLMLLAFELFVLISVEFRAKLTQRKLCHLVLKLVLL